MMNADKKRHGFTLVELSIVLVIVALIVGGVLGGQSLIHASQLRSVTTQYNNYYTATRAFRDKYFALPGDMTNATQFWGAAHATPATCRTTASTTALTCNGDGDNRIMLSTGSAEQFRYWQHLANAGLIEGSYAGMSTDLGEEEANSTNVPRGKFANGLWHMVYVWDREGYSGAGGIFNGSYGNSMFYGAQAATKGPDGKLFKPEDMWNIDLKMDDGKPAMGKIIITAQDGVHTCTTSALIEVLTGDYLLTSNAVACAAIFRQQF